MANTKNLSHPDLPSDGNRRDIQEISGDKHSPRPISVQPTGILYCQCPSSIGHFHENEKGNQEVASLLILATRSPNGQGIHQTSELWLGSEQAEP